MTTTFPIHEAERARRRDYVRDSKAAATQREPLEHRIKRRETQADEWARWFRNKMDEGRCADPVELLPDAFARLEQQASDRIAAALKDFKTVLKEALK